MVVNIRGNAKGVYDHEGFREFLGHYGEVEVALEYEFGKVYHVSGLTAVLQVIPPSMAEVRLFGAREDEVARDLRDCKGRGLTSLWDDVSAEE